MKIVTPKQMKMIEERSEKVGVSRKKLMENAGKALAEIIDSYCRRTSDAPPEEKSIVFLAGKGNNGGDCFAAANILVYRGYRITVINIGGKPSTDLAKEMYLRLPKERIVFVDGYRSQGVEAAIEAAELDYMSVPRVNELEKASDKRELNPLERILMQEKLRMSQIKSAVLEATVVVDGVYGTGFRDQLDKNAAGIFAIGSSAYRIAVDVPSGGNSVTGTVAFGAFEADETVTFGFIKSGMTQYPLRKYCGKITVADIGIPREALDVLDGERAYYRIERNHLASFPPRRERDSYKGTFGTLLVIAGSSSMRGAASFAALGALRTGVGHVRIASVEKCIDTMSVLVPEATYIELESDDYGYMLFDTSKDELLKAMNGASAIVIGCGMGVTPDTIEITRFVVQNAKCPVIIDADGINCIASDIDILLGKKTDIVITPHVGEMARLLNCDNAMISNNRIVVAEKYAEKYGVTVVLKGAGTLIANSRVTAANHTGNPGMSVGGSGDILAGIIGSIIAQGCSVYDSTCAGVYIHGLAGDIAAEKLGMESMLPRDIIDCLSDSFRVLKEKKTQNN
ncbi:MAG: NAD(P)H-hydrate dehydratase [Ruminococcus sp.]|nr:NAD(P)H-hydrate dehydratase [Ruminococcus sp.]MBQ9078553.1 NAD(P)H-hydrate dehydratase [Ruminococcus sp.]MBR6622454.1 NAD(P)H-hydrate dehydratase [Ruminococcus sp.]